MMGGRAAEELVFHDPTTGASNDIEKATNVARAMVTQYGMTERLGAIKLGSGDAEPFLGRDFGHQRDYSEDIAAIVDEEVSKLISNAHQEAFDILTENRDVLDDLVRALFERETLDRAAVAEVFQPLRLWPKRPAWTGSDSRVPSSIPPVTPPPPVDQRPERSERPSRQRSGAAASRSVGAPGRRRSRAARSLAGAAVLPAGPGAGRWSTRCRRPAGSRRHRRTVRSVVRWSELAAGGTRLPMSLPTPTGTSATRRRARRGCPATVRSSAGRGRRPGDPRSGSVRIPTGTACGTPRSGSPGRTRRCSSGCGRTREEVLATTFDLGPRRVRAGQGHRGVELLRAPPGAVHRGRPRRLHPERRRHGSPG